MKLTLKWKLGRGYPNPVDTHILQWLPGPLWFPLSSHQRFPNLWPLIDAIPKHWCNWACLITSIFNAWSTLEWHLNMWHQFLYSKGQIYILFIKWHGSGGVSLSPIELVLGKNELHRLDQHIQRLSFSTSNFKFQFNFPLPHAIFCSIQSRDHK
jgi:hypothetical protein